MEEYPEELRTPPVTLVSLVGRPELHTLITNHLQSEQPPINTLALPDFARVSVMVKKSKESATENPPAGILKRDWLLKHRTKVPAVLAAMFSSDHISGDPAQWVQVCTDLDNVKAIVRPRNIKLVVIVVQGAPSDEITEDRIIALRKRAEVDSKHLVVITPNDATELEQSLKRLGSTFAELANVYYRDEGRRVKMRVEKKSLGSIELHIRCCFKVAVYAEFRRDWIEALRFYEEAYHALREMIGTSTRLPAIQRLVEIKTIAELLHFKMATLLLHGGKVVEAIRWFRQHNASYRKLLGAPEAVFLHWEWMSRQFLVFAELLETSSASALVVPSLVVGSADRPLTEWELQPAYYYQLASQYLKEKRSSLEFALSMSESANEIDGSGESVVTSSYVGQFARLLEQGVDAFSMQPITDEEYTRYALAEGKRFQDSFEIIALLKKSFELYNSLKAHRMGSLCGHQMGREYFAVGDFSNAKQFFDVVASLYRKEGWVTLLWEVLGYLRECSKECGIVKDFIEYSLEMAALPVSSATGIESFRFKECGPAGPPSLVQREHIHRNVFGFVSGELGFSPNEENNGIKVTEDNPLHLEIDLVSPLRVVLLASVAFHEQMIKPGASSLITLSFLSQLPLTVEINQLDIQFNQSECNFTITNAQKPPLAVISGEHGSRVESAPSLALVTNKWLRLTYDIKSEQTGKLECVSIIAKMGPHFTICCRAESPASMDDLPLWKFEDRVETFPTKDPALAFSGQKATQIEEPDPQVDVNLGASGPALVGEIFVVPVTVASKGHAVFSGELKINLVDLKGGSLFSPRETEAYATDSNDVEILGIAGSEGEDEPHLGTEKVKKIQQSFGLLSIPFLKSGESWSCNIEIKWHRPKSIMLFVSLGYSPQSNEINAQKVHVHKSLQIEGQTAVVISHRFMMPFRRDSLLLSRIKPVPNSDQSMSLPLDETSVLMVSSKSCTEVPLQLLGMTIEPSDDDNEGEGEGTGLGLSLSLSLGESDGAGDGDENGIASSCSVQPQGEDLSDPALLVPGEEFKKVFAVTPDVNSSKLRLGTVHLKWRRDSKTEIQSKSSTAWVLTKHRLPDVKVELSPLVVSLECPPYAILGEPFSYLVKIRNQTQLLQEVKFSLADSQSFVLSGSHNDTVFILPKTEHVVSFKLVPFSTGSQQLPKISLTSLRYSAGFQPAVSACSVFVFPSKPNFKTTEVVEDNKRVESVAAE